MELPDDYKDRILSITESINHVTEASNNHLPDKIANILTNIKLLEFEVEKLKELNNLNKV